MLQTVILMAGRGTRFLDLDPDRPKPLVRLHGKPLIEWVVKNLRAQEPQKFIFVCLEDHIQHFSLWDYFKSLDVDFTIASVPEVTEGSACSALAAAVVLNDEETLIVNADQIMRFDLDFFLKDCRQQSAEGGIVTIEAQGNNWSYVKTNVRGEVVEVQEKTRISDRATAGLYYFKSPTLLTSSIEEMMRKNDRVNGEFYLAPSFNYFPKGSKTIQHYIGLAGQAMTSLGTKEDFLSYAEDPGSLAEFRRLFE